MARSGRLLRFGLQARLVMVVAALLGFVFGFFGSMPIAGPIAALVFSWGLEDRARNAFYLAVGAALAEGGYAYLAFWGFSAFLIRYAWVEPVSRAVAAVILTGLGLGFVFRRSNADESAPRPDPSAGRKRSFVLGFTVTALNPTLIATWTGAVTFVYSLGIVRFDARSALPFSLGAAVGITLWFTTLLALLRRFRARFSEVALARVMRVMGVFLLLCGVFFAVRFAQSMLAH